MSTVFPFGKFEFRTLKSKEKEKEKEKEEREKMPNWIGLNRVSLDQN